MRFIVALLLLIAPSPATATNNANFTSFSTGSVSTRAKLDSSSIVWNDTQPSIIGGVVAGSSEFPWFGRTEILFDLGIQGLLGFSCGGSLIHRDIVVSAAHCVVDTI